MAKAYVLTEKDYQRFQNALRWCERNYKQRPDLQRRRRGGQRSGAVISLPVYARQSDAAGDGEYNCYLQAGSSGAWGNANTDSVVCKTQEASGHGFTGTDLLIAVGAADGDGKIPVVPYGYGFWY